MYLLEKLQQGKDEDLYCLDNLGDMPHVGEEALFNSYYFFYSYLFWKLVRIKEFADSRPFTLTLPSVVLNSEGASSNLS